MIEKIKDEYEVAYEKILSQEFYISSLNDLKKKFPNNYQDKDFFSMSGKNCFYPTY